MMNIQCLSISMILIVLSFVHINASVRQTTVDECPYANFNFCDYVRCENGQCVENKTIAECYTCRCSAGYTGSLCETSIVTPTGCNPACQNGGRCEQTIGNTYACVCSSDYTGLQCETSVLSQHACVISPQTTCLNGGTCTVNGAGYLCNCPVGWTGANCQTQNALTTCDPNPCGAHGTCIQAILPSNALVAFCRCESQWTGTLCEVGLTGTCSVGFCEAGGICQMNGTTPYCICPSTHTGQHCETLIAPLSTTTTAPIIPGNCATSPCLNGGTCYNSGISFICLCTSQYSGPTCSTSNFVTTTTAVTPTTPTLFPTTANPTTRPVLTGNCATSPCLNGGTCYNTGNSFICLCTSQYSGATCTMQNSLTTTLATTSSSSNACAPNPCMNGGACYKTGSSFVCVCTAQFAGSLCDLFKTSTVPAFTTPSSTITCANQPCRNGGTCYNAGSTYFCYCGANSNHSGTNCDTPKVTLDPNCPLNCLPGQCIRSGGSINAYACMCNGTLTPTSCPPN